MLRGRYFDRALFRAEVREVPRDQCRTRMVALDSTRNGSVVSKDSVYNGPESNGIHDSTLLGTRGGYAYLMGDQEMWERSRWRRGEMAGERGTVVHLRAIGKQAPYSSANHSA